MRGCANAQQPRRASNTLTVVLSPKNAEPELRAGIDNARRAAQAAAASGDVRRAIRYLADAECLERALARATRR